MSMVGENQVRHMYVAGAFPAHATISAVKAGANLDVAILQPSGVAIVNNSEFLLALKNNKGTITISDVVNPKRVSYAHSKKYSGRLTKVVTLSDIPVVANQLYIVAIPIAGYGSLSAEDEYIKEGYYKSKTGDTVENIVDGLIQSLARNFSRENPQAGTRSAYTLKGGTVIQIEDNVVFEFDKLTTDGTAEVSTVTFGSVATASGNITLTLNGTVKVIVPIVAGQTVTASALATVAAVNALDSKDYVATNVAGVVTITASNKRSEVDLALAVGATTWTTTAPAAATTVAGVSGVVFGLKISEKNWLPTYYVTGKKTRLYLDFHVDARFPGDTLPTITTVPGADGSGTGYQVRNMEYYFLGNRQDSFRGMGYPNNFDAVYDSKLDGQYQLIEIGYWDESRDDPMKSKKQITIAIENLAQANLLIAEINKSLLATGIVIATLA